MKNYKGLAYRNLKNDKRNTGFIFITMILVIALMVGTIILSKFKLQNEFAVVEKREGKYDVRLLDVSKDQVNQLKESENVESIYLGKSLGVNIFPIENYTYNYRIEYLESDYSINELYAVDLNVFDKVFNYELKAGRMPQNENEVMVTTQMLSEYSGVGVDLGVNNEVTLDFETNRTYDMYRTYSYFKDSILRITDYDRWYSEEGYTGFDGTWLNDEYGQLVKEEKTLKVVGIIDVGDNNILWHNKLFTVLSPEAMSKYTDFEVITKLEDGVTDKEIAEEIGLKYIQYDRNADNPNPGHGLGASRVRYPNYWKQDYDVDNIYNTWSIELTIVSILSFIIIFNAFIGSIAFRTKSMGILTSIGCSKKQIRSMVFRETFVITVISIPIGIALGILQVKVLSMILSKVLSVDLSNLNIGLNTNDLIVILVLVAILALGSIIYALKRFYRYTPIEAMNNSSGINSTTYKTKYGEVINEEQEMEQILKHEENTFKFKFMKKVFKLEGTIAYKNLSRNRAMNKNCKISIMATMLLGAAFFCQYTVNSVAANYAIPSNEWNVEAEKGANNYTDEDIENIKQIDGVEDVYREMTNTTQVIAKNKDISTEEINLIKNELKWLSGDEYSVLNTRVRGIDKNSIDLYSKYLIDGDLTSELKEDEIILVSDWVNYKMIVSDGGVRHQIVDIENVLNYKVGDEINIPLNQELLVKEEVEDKPSDSYYSNGGETKKFKVKAIVSKDALRESERFSDANNCSEDLMIIVSDKCFANIYGVNTQNKLDINVDKDNREVVVENLKMKLYDSGDSITDLVDVQNQLNKENMRSISLNLMFAISVVILVVVSLISTMIFNIFIRSRELAGLDAIGMNFKQKKKMIVCESFSMALQTAFIAMPASLTLVLMSIGNEFGRGGTNESLIFASIIIYIVVIMIITTLIGLVPIGILKNQSISELLRD